MLSHLPALDHVVMDPSTFPLGHLRVRRSGYGAMQLAGPFAFGTPPDRASAIGVLRAALAAGVDHVDTAQYYGPGAVNDLIREALYPYPAGLAIVSKVAVRSAGSGAVSPSGDPDGLHAGIEDNLRSLRVAQLAAVNLRLPGDGRIDARFDDQLAAMVAARDKGLIAGIGLSSAKPSSSTRSSEESGTPSCSSRACGTRVSASSQARPGDSRSDILSPRNQARLRVRDGRPMEERRLRPTLG
jgi:pyridoxine 4-dehydrogenase